MRYKKRQFTLIITLSAILFSVFFFACNNQNTANEKRNISLQKIDSLWMGLQETKGLFGYKMDEFIDRKSQMQKNLTLLKFVDGQKINEENLSNVRQYNAMFRVYRGIGQQYKDAVLGAEALFYEIKGLETELKKGNYDKEIANFVKEYQSIKIQLFENHKKALDVTNQLKAIEPAYQRISPLVDALVESVQEK